MLQFILKRLWSSIWVLLGIILILFFLFSILPSSRSNKLNSEKNSEILSRGNKNASTFLLQFFYYLNDLSPLSFQNTKNQQSFIYLDTENYGNVKSLLQFENGRVLVLKFPYLQRSFETNQKVSEIIEETLPATLLLVLFSLLIAAFFGIIMGSIAALNKGNTIDTFCTVFTVFCMAGPTFFIGILVAWIFGYLLSNYTGLNMTGSLYTLDDYGNGEFLDLKNIILPALTLSIRPIAIISQLTRSSLLDVLDKDYVRTAKAKGLSYFKVLIRHVFKNALSPIITAISGWIAGLLASAVFVEYIFGWKGIGKVVVDALVKNDLPLVAGILLVFSFIFLVIQLVVDILNAWLNPRIDL